MRRNLITGGLIAAAALAVGIGGTATASSLIYSKDIADGAVHRVDLSPGINRDLGRSALPGAVYRVENYKNGGGGSATVACADTEAKSQKYVAISGGVQGSTVASQAADGFAVSSSFPGRMNWDTGEPKAGRLDGWIVLGNGQYTSTLKVWALCVPRVNIPVQQVDLDN